MVPTIYGSIQESAPVMAQSNRMGGSSVNAPVYVTVNSDGSSSVKGGGGADNMKQLGAMMGAKCREVMVQESRTGGLLNPV